MRGAEWYTSLSELFDTLNDAVDVRSMESLAVISSVYPGRMAPVVPLLEELAVRELEKPLYDRVELVAIGYDVPGGVEWIKLTNVAVREPWRNFQISGPQMQAVLRQIADALGDDLLGDIGRDTEDFRSHVTVWHSHYDVQGPSAFDLEFFPAWLAKVAMIYHAPSQTTIPYEAMSGDKSSTRGATQASTSSEGH